MSKLLIVESPGKIKKISEYLGDEYIVMASIGHIIDLDETKMSIDLETFEPQYKIYEDKMNVVDNLIKKTIKVGTQTFFKVIRDGIMVYNVDTKKLVVVEQHAKEAVPIEPETNIGDMCKDFGEIPKILTEPEVIDFSISYIETDVLFKKN